MASKLKDDVQIEILVFLDELYPNRSTIVDTYGEQVSHFWAKFPSAVLNANLQYMQELKEISVAWQYMGDEQFPISAKIVKGGIHRLAKIRSARG